VNTQQVASRSPAPVLAPLVVSPRSSLYEIRYFMLSWWWRKRRPVRPEMLVRFRCGFAVSLSASQRPVVAHLIPGATLAAIGLPEYRRMSERLRREHGARRSRAGAAMREPLRWRVRAERGVQF